MNNLLQQDLSSSSLFFLHSIFYMLLFSFNFILLRPAGACAFCENHFFKDRSKSRFDSGFVIYAKFRAEHARDLVGSCFLRRVMAEQR